MQHHLATIDPVSNELTRSYGACHSIHYQSLLQSRTLSTAGAALLIYWSYQASLAGKLTRITVACIAIIAALLINFMTILF